MTDANFWSDVGQHEKAAEFWLAHPRVRAYVNESVSGDPNVWPLEWFKSSGFGDRPLGRVLSIGCGLGGLERELVRSGLAAAVEGIDLHRKVIEEAERLARTEGFGGLIRYHTGDAHDYLKQHQATFDAIFFHASLHHFPDPESTLRLCRDSLRPGGLLYVDEFVGRSMKDWRIRDLVLPNILYRLLPAGVRRVGVIRKPVNPEDPSEAISAGRILSAIDRSFEVVDRRDYGGNLLSLLYPNLQLPQSEDATKVFDDAISFLIDAEQLMLKHTRITQWTTFHTVIVARPSRLVAASSQG